ncbi:dockerin type I domain-containing protein [Thermodesulfobacteriota bacterium]
MKNILIGAALIVFLAGITHAAPVVYTNESLYLTDLAALGYPIIHESFENDTVWADSRNSISSPGSTSTVTSQGIVWTSNYPQNNIATGTVGGSAPDGSFAIYSLPHGMTTDSGLYCDSAEDPDIPIQCYQNDGLKIGSETGDTLYAFGGRIDTSNSGKVTFLLDGVDVNGNDTDNIDNWQREGDSADNWAFVGVIDEDGFLSAELRELRGKDFQQVLLFADDFHFAVSILKRDLNNDQQIDLIDAIFGLQLMAGINLAAINVSQTDVNTDGRIGMADVVYILQKLSGSR